MSQGNQENRKKDQSQEEWSFGASRLTRSGFLKISGAGVASDALLRVAGCGSGDGGGGGTLTIDSDQEPDMLNPFIVGGDLSATIIESPTQIQPGLTLKSELADGEPSRSMSIFRPRSSTF